MFHTGDGLAAVALPAGQISPHRVEVSGLFDMAVFTAAVIVEFNSLMGVGQTGTNPHFSSCRTVTENASCHAGYFNKRSLSTGFGLIFLIITGAGFAILVTTDRGGNLILGRRRRRQEHDSCRQQGCAEEKYCSDSCLFFHIRLLHNYLARWYPMGSIGCPTGLGSFARAFHSSLSLLRSSFLCL